MNRFENQLVVVTGAAQGIGKVIAQKFLAEGATVILAGRTLAKVEAAAKEMGNERAIPFQLEVSKDEDWAKLVEFIEKNYDGLDVLVNNAALTNNGRTIINTTNEEFDRVCKANLYGIFYGMRNCYKVMKKGVYAGIVNIGSFAGLTVNKGSGNDVAYQTTKHAIRQMTKHAALNMAADCIRVNVVHPGAAMTPMLEAYLRDVGADASVLAENNPLPPHYVRPEEVAEAVMFLADRKAARPITGSELSVDSAAALL